MTAAEYASQATDGAGSTLEVGNGASPEVFTAIAEVEAITPGAQSTESIEVTHLLSPAAHKELIPGKRATGGFGIKGNWRPEDDSQSNAAPAGDLPGGLVYLARTRAVRNFRVVLGNSGSPQIAWACRGFISSFQPGELQLGSKKSFSAEIMPSQDVSADLP